MRDLREIGPTHVLLAPRVWEQTAADVRARIMDAGRARRGGCSSGRSRVGTAARGARAAAPARRPAGVLGPARPAGLLAAEVGRDRRGRARARHVPLLPRHGRAAASSSTARPRPPAPTRCRSTPRSTATAPGVPFDDTEIRVVDPDESGVGEILTRHRRPVQRLFRQRGGDAARRLAEDGWLRTGDAGFLDAKGRLTVIDRVKDIARTADAVPVQPAVHREQAQVLALSSASAWCSAMAGPSSPRSCASATRWWRSGPRRAGSASPPTRTWRRIREVGELLAGEVEKVNASLPEAAAHPPLRLCSTRSSTRTTAS